MRLTRWFGTSVIGLTLVATLSAPAFADYPAKHPHYVHAMEYLRDAHSLLSHVDYNPNVDMRIDYALQDIGRAYSDIKKAGLDDGKDVDGGMPPEARLDRQGRLHKAEEALQRALQDVSLEEDDTKALGLRDRATVQINYAIEHLHRAMAFIH